MRQLFGLLLKHQFGVFNFDAIKRNLSIALADADFVMTAINKLHSSHASAFIEFLSSMKCDWLPILNVLACTEDSGTNASNVLNAMVGVFDLHVRRKVS